MADPCRLLIDPAAAGAWNMAADEVLLDGATGGRPALRFYGWSEPTLTLGYFQPHLPSRAVPPLDALAWLRRPTGGAAIVHHHELTYSLALPPGPDWQPAGRVWMIRMHELIRAALAGLGVRAALCAQEKLLGDTLCFLHHTPGDLVLAGHKIAGSAQRKQRGSLLQHGSILLRRSRFAPTLPGLAELSGREILAEDLRMGLIEALTQETGWRLEPSSWTESEKPLISQRVADRYGAVGWNEKR